MNQQKFGQYLLLDELKLGQFSKIFNGGLPENPKTEFVIKIMDSSFGASNEFHKVVEGEFPPTMQLSHPNIVQYFDYGFFENQPYVIMEWVDGKYRLDVLKKIEKCQVKRPSAINPKVPAEIDAIVLMAFQRDIDGRIQTAGEFQATLHRGLYAFYPKFNLLELGAFFK